MSTNDNVHSSSAYWVLTGNKYSGSNARMIQPTDWPYFGSLVKKLRPSDDIPALTSVWLPEIMRLNEGVTPAGQTAGFLGKQWEPDRFLGDPSLPSYEVRGLRPTGIPPLQLKRRVSLLEQIDEHFGALERGAAVAVYDRFQTQALDLLTSDRARKAFDLSQEPKNVRERYGRGEWGQSVLLARRLVEAGVRLVHVNWSREPGDSAVDNPMWDTHAQNADRLEDALCPQFDLGFTALIHDLEQRGLLEETLVVAVGEFGRTPRINSIAGRDHWGAVFSLALAGAGISGGQVFGASDRNGAYPTRDRVEPQDLTATIFHLLGIDHRSKFRDREDRELQLTEGEPLYTLLGDAPATTQRCEPEGDVARLGSLNTAPLLNTEFRDPVPLRRVDLGSRPKGWRATPIEDDDATGPFSVALLNQETSLEPLSSPEASLADSWISRLREPHVVFSTGGDGSDPREVSTGSKDGFIKRAILAQEIRNPRVGTYTFRVACCGDGSSRHFFERVFADEFKMQLILYRYSESTKNPMLATTLATQEVRPAFLDPKGAGPSRFELKTDLDSGKPGRNFAVGRGLGVAIVIEQQAAQPSDHGDDFALVRIFAADLSYTHRPRNEDVRV